MTMFSFLFCFLILIQSQAQTQETKMLPRATPESQGISSAAIEEFVSAVDEKITSMHSFMLIRHGQVVAECYWAPYHSDLPHMLYSLSKSFTSTAVGFAIAEGKLQLDDPVISFFPDDLPQEISENLKKMRVRDLLSMSCGHENETSYPDETWVKSFLAHPVPFEPGTHFRYNTPGTYMLSAIVQKVTGQTVLDYLKPRLFEPLGIENPYWETSPQGISKGGTGLFVRTEDIAKFGQLYLQKGNWNGEQLLPQEWVETATSKKISNGDPSKQSDWSQGYCFQFWRCQHNCFRGDGAHGQFCVVMPDQDAVVVMTADSNNLQGQLNFVWEILLPAMKNEALPENPTNLEKLNEKCSKLIAGYPGGSRSQVLPEQTISSKILQKEMKFSVYLPAGYKTSAEPMPVLYLLHGTGGDAMNWLNKDAAKIADETFQNGLAQPMIIVIPDGELTWYMNSPNGDYQYEDYFVNELIPYINEQYRCKTDKSNRFVAGLSMGGFGSLLLSLHYPELFDACYAMSAAFYTDDEIRNMSVENIKNRHETPPLGDIEDKEKRLTDFWYQNSIFDLVQKMPAEQKKSVRFFLDCGDDDYYCRDNALLFAQMIDLQIAPVEFRVRNGGHSWEYWQTALPMALEFFCPGK